MSKFNESDKKNIIEFLNLVAEKATFSLDTKEVIRYYGLLNYMQRDLLPKVSDNIMEIIKVVDSDDSSKDKA